ncbi:MAG TPA: DoxX family protein, partial [Thermoanaerobaculia bacterium]|nr:DoxX family protein [Thermoanaerobaculia bacterium]
MTILGKHAERIYGLMRFVVGFLFACHGAQKLFGTFGGQKVTGNTLLTVAAVIELVAGGLVALGLFTAPAAFLASGEMAVAYFKAHAAASFWPIVNKGEPAVLYC